jgi:hypothetical protein
LVVLRLTTVGRIFLIGEKRRTFELDK